MKPQVIPITPDHDEVRAIATALTAAMRENGTTDRLVVEVRSVPWGYYVSAVPADGVAVAPQRKVGATSSDDQLVKAEVEYRDTLAKLDRDLYDVLAMVARDSGLSDIEAEAATRAAIRAALAGARDAAEQYCESSLNQRQIGDLPDLPRSLRPRATITSQRADTAKISMPSADLTRTTPRHPRRSETGLRSYRYEGRPAIGDRVRGNRNSGVQHLPESHTSLSGVD